MKELQFCICCCFLILFQNSIHVTTVDAVPAFRLEYSWDSNEHDNPQLIDNENENYDRERRDYATEEDGGTGSSYRLAKRENLEDDAKRMFNDKLTVQDPAMNAMQGSILVEQRNELAALKDDAAFEDSAMASLQDDERKMESDERKVDDDRKRKFGKHKKRWRNDNKDNDAKVNDEKVDLDTKIRQFSDSLGHSDDNADDHHSEDENENEKRDQIPGSFDLGDDMLEDFASPDRHVKKHSVIREPLSSTSESPAQILGNIAKIFENVNQKNEALLVRKRKTMSRDGIPHPHDTVIDRNADEEEEGDNEFRKIKNVIPRTPKSNSKYDVIANQKQAPDGKMLALQSLDPIFDNPSYLIDPENPDVESLVEDIVQASSVKKKRDTVSSVPKSLSENVAESGSGAGFTGGVEITGEPEYFYDDRAAAKGKNKDKADEENDWIVGSADILKSKEASKNKKKQKLIKKEKSSKKKKLPSEAHKVVNTVNNKNHYQKKTDKAETSDDDDWISGTSDVITEYLKKKKEMELALKKKMIASASGSGSGGGSGEFEYVVKPYSPVEKQQQKSTHSNDEKPHSSEDLPNKVNQTLPKDLVQEVHQTDHQQQQQQHELSRQPETLRELVAPLQTTNGSKNASSDFMNQLVDKVVESQNLRNDYLFQLTHQEPVGLVGTNNEVESVLGNHGAVSSVMTGSVRGQIQGEDDTEVVMMPVEVDCSSASGGSSSGSGSGSGSGCKYTPIVPKAQKKKEKKKSKGKDDKKKKGGSQTSGDAGGYGNDQQQPPAQNPPPNQPQPPPNSPQTPPIQPTPGQSQTMVQPNPGLPFHQFSFEKSSVQLEPKIGVNIAYDSKDDTWGAIMPSNVVKEADNSTKKYYKASKKSKQNVEMIYDSKSKTWGAAVIKIKKPGDIGDNQNTTKKFNQPSKGKEGARINYDPATNTWGAVSEDKYNSNSDDKQSGKRQDTPVKAGKDKIGAKVEYNSKTKTWGAVPGDSDNADNSKNSTKRMGSRPLLASSSSKGGKPLRMKYDPKADTWGTVPEKEGKSSKYSKSSKGAFMGINNEKDATRINRRKRENFAYTSTENNLSEVRNLSKKKKRKSKNKKHNNNNQHQQHLGNVGKAKSRRKRIKMIMTRKRKNIPFAKNFANLLRIEDESGSGSGDEDDIDPLNERSLIAIIPTQESDESGNSQDQNSGVASSQDPNSGVVEMSYENNDPQSSTSDLLAKKTEHQSNGTKKSSFKLNVKNYFPKRLILENIRHQKSHPAGKRDHIETNNDDLDLDEDDFFNDDDELNIDDEDEPGRGRSTVTTKERVKQQDDLMNLSSKFQHPNIVESSVKYRNVTCCEQSMKNPNFKQNCCSKRSQITKQHDISCCKNLKVTWGGVDLSSPTGPEGFPSMPSPQPGHMETAGLHPFNMTTGVISQPGDIGIVGGMEVFPLPAVSVPDVNLAAPGPVSLADVVRAGEEMTKATNKMKYGNTKTSMPPSPTPSSRKSTDAPTWINFSLNPSKGVAVHPAPPKNKNKNGGGIDEDNDKDIKVVWGSIGVTTTPTPNRYENSTSNNKAGDFKVHGTNISVTQPPSGNENKPNPIKVTTNKTTSDDGSDSGKYGNKEGSPKKGDSSEKGHSTKEKDGQKKPADSGPVNTDRPGVNNKQPPSGGKGELNKDGDNVPGDASKDSKKKGKGGYQIPSSSSTESNPADSGPGNTDRPGGKEDSNGNIDSEDSRKPSGGKGDLSKDSDNGPGSASKDSKEKGKGGSQTPSTESNEPPPPPSIPSASKGNESNQESTASKGGKKISGKESEKEKESTKDVNSGNSGNKGGKAGLGNSEEGKQTGDQLNSPVPTKSQKNKNKTDNSINKESEESLSGKNKDDENGVVSIPKVNENEKDKPTVSVPSKLKVENKGEQKKPSLPTGKTESKEQEKGTGSSMAISTAVAQGSKSKPTQSLQNQNQPTQSNSNQGLNSQPSSPSTTNANQTPSGSNLPNSESANNNINNNGNQNNGVSTKINGNRLNQLSSTSTGNQVQAGQNLPSAQPVAGANTNNGKAPAKLGTSETSSSNSKNKEQADNLSDQNDDNDSGVGSKGSSTNIKISTDKEDENSKSLKEGTGTKGKKAKDSDKTKQSNNPSSNKITPATTLQPVTTTTEKSSNNKQKEGSNVDSEEDEDIEDAITNTNTNTPTPQTQPTTPAISTKAIATTLKPKTTTTTPAPGQPGNGSNSGDRQGNGGTQGTTGKQKKPTSNKGSKKPMKKPESSKETTTTQENQQKTTTAAPTIVYTKTSFKIICLPINWPCAQNQKLTTVAPSYYPSTNNNNNNNNNNNTPVDLLSSKASKDLQNGGKSASSSSANATTTGRPAPVPKPSDLFEESENNKTMVAQPVLPLVPVNDCTGTSCVPPSPPFNCIPGFPCPIEDLNIIDPQHPTKTPPPSQAPGLPAKINVWAIETVETHVKNVSSVISISPTTATTTTMSLPEAYLIASQPTQPVNQPPTQSKTPVPGPEFPNFPAGVDPPTYQQVSLSQNSQETAVKDATPNIQEINNQSLNIRGPTVQQTSAYQKISSDQPTLAYNHPAVGVQGPTFPQTNNNTNKETSLIQTNSLTGNSHNQYNSEMNKKPSPAASTEPPKTTSLPNGQKSGDKSPNVMYQSPATPSPGQTPPPTEAPSPQFLNIGISTTNPTPTSATSTVKTIRIEGKDDGLDSTHGATVPPPNFGNDESTTTTTAPTTTLFNPYLPNGGQQQGEMSTPPPFVTISSTTPTTEATYKPIDIYQASSTLNTPTTPRTTQTPSDQTSPIMQTSPTRTTPRPTSNKTATDDNKIKIILGDTLNDGEKQKQHKDEGDKIEDSDRKQTVLNIDEYLLSLSTTISPTTAHPSAEFDVGDHTHDEIASDLDDRNNENNTGHFALLPLPPALVKINDSVARSSNGELDGMPAAIDNNNNNKSTEEVQNEAESNGTQTADNRLSSYEEFMKKYYQDDEITTKATSKPPADTEKEETKEDKNNPSYVDSIYPTIGFQTTPKPTKKYAPESASSTSKPSTVLPPTTPSTFVSSTPKSEQMEKNDKPTGKVTSPVTSPIATTKSTAQASTPSDKSGNSSESSGYAGFPSYEEYLNDYYQKQYEADSPSTPTPATTVDKNKELSVEEQSPLNPYLPTEAPNTTEQQQEPVPGPEEESSNTEDIDTTSKTENRPQQSKEEDEFSNVLSQLKNFDLDVEPTSSTTKKQPTTTELPITRSPVAAPNLFNEIEKSTNPIEKSDDSEPTRHLTTSDEDVKEKTSTTTAPEVVDAEEAKSTDDQSKSGTVWGFSSYEEYMKNYMKNLNDFYKSNSSPLGSVDNFNKPTEIPAEPSPPTTPSATTKSKQDSELPAEPPSFESNVIEAQDDQASLSTKVDETTSEILDEISTQKPTYPQTSARPLMSSAPPTTTPAFTITKGKVSEPKRPATLFTTSPAPTTIGGRKVTSQKPDLQTQTAKTEDTNTPTGRPSVTSPLTTRVPPVTSQSPTSPEWMEIEILPKTDGETDETSTSTTTTNAPATTTKPSDNNSDDQLITRPNDATTRSQTPASQVSSETGTEETITQSSMKVTSTGGDRSATTPSTTTSSSKDEEAVTTPQSSASSLSYDGEQNQDSAQTTQSPSTSTTDEQSDSLAPNEDAVFITESSNTTPSPTTPSAQTNKTATFGPNEDTVFITESSDTTLSSTTPSAQGNVDLTATTIQPLQTDSISPEAPVYIDNNPTTPTLQTTQNPNQYETTYYGFSSYEEYLSDFYKKMADRNQPQIVDTVLNTKESSEATPILAGNELKPEGIQGPAYPSPVSNNAETVVPLAPTTKEPTTTTTLSPSNTEMEASLPTTPSTTTAWPWNDLNYDYRYMWETYSQVLQKWANKYMAPVEHHNVTVWPNSHPTMNPNRTGLQSEYETYLGNFEKWEAKNRPYVPTTPKTLTTTKMVPENKNPADLLQTTQVPPVTTPVPSLVVVNPYQQQQPYPSQISTPDDNTLSWTPTTTLEETPSPYVIPSTSNQEVEQLAEESTSQIPIEAKEDDMSLFKSPMETSTQPPPQQKQQQQQLKDQQSIILPQGPLVTSNLEPFTTTVPVTTPLKKTTTKEPDPSTIDNFPNYNIPLHDFNVWDQNRPQYPEFSHQQAQAPANPSNEDQDQKVDQDSDTDVLPIDSLPGFASSVPYVQTTASPTVTKPQTTTVSAASLLAKLVNKPSNKEEVTVAPTNKESGNTNQNSAVDPLNSIDGPSLGEGVLKPSTFAQDQTQQQSSINTNIEYTSNSNRNQIDATSNSAELDERILENQSPPVVEATIANNLESNNKDETPTTPIPAVTINQPEQVPTENTTPPPTQPQPSPPPSPLPPQGASNVLQESSTVESFQNENIDKQLDNTLQTAPPQDNRLPIDTPPPVLDDVVQQSSFTTSTSSPVPTEASPPTTPMTSQPIDGTTVPEDSLQASSPIDDPVAKSTSLQDTPTVQTYGSTAALPVDNNDLKNQMVPTIEANVLRDPTDTISNDSGTVENVTISDGEPSKKMSLSQLIMPPVVHGVEDDRSKDGSSTTANQSPESQIVWDPQNTQQDSFVGAASSSSSNHIESPSESSSNSNNNNNVVMERASYDNQQQQEQQQQPTMTKQEEENIASKRNQIPKPYEPILSSRSRIEHFSSDDRNNNDIVGYEINLKPNYLDLPAIDDGVNWRNVLEPEYIVNPRSLNRNVARDGIPGLNPNDELNSKTFKEPYMNFIKRSYFPKVKSDALEESDVDILPPSNDDLDFRKKKR